MLVPEGKIVGNRYRIAALIGRGGFGFVCRAEHITLKKPFAIKFLSREYIIDSKLVKRFKREATAACTIGHSNIIDIVDFGFDTDLGYYFVMELLEGETLAKKVKREGALYINDYMPILLQVCDALIATHRKGIVHRDLKSENIFLIKKDLDRNFVKILDFGISSILSEEKNRITRTSHVWGTPIAMAPEQIRGQKVDHLADIYSFGVIMYEVVTGMLPFEADSSIEVFLQHLEEKAIPPTKLRKDLDIDPEVEKITMRCLEKNKLNRYQSSMELKADLIALQMKIDPEAFSDHKILPFPSRIPDSLRATRPFPIFTKPQIFITVIFSIIFLAASASITYMLFFRNSENKIPDFSHVHHEPLKDPFPGMHNKDTVVHSGKAEIKIPEKTALNNSYIPFSRKNFARNLPAKEASSDLSIEIATIPPEAQIFLAGNRESAGTTPSTITLSPAKIPEYFVLKKKGYSSSKVKIDRAKIFREGILKIQVKLLR
jgi:serine/threonine protein kinase